jgi:hypothetical protein
MRSKINIKHHVTYRPNNEELEDKQFVLQHTKRGFRCISWHPHYIETRWTRKRDDAIIDGDEAIDKYWENNEI